MFRTRATTLLGIIFSLHRILPFFLINFLTSPLYRHPIQLLSLNPTVQNFIAYISPYEMPASFRISRMYNCGNTS